MRKMKRKKKEKEKVRRDIFYMIKAQHIVSKITRAKNK